MQDRREFIKSTCSMCVAVVSFGLLLTEESCKPTAGVGTMNSKDKISVPLSQLKEQKTFLVKNPTLEYDILLVRKTEAEYIALQMRCTHRGSNLELKNGKLTCPSHGSEFDLDGKVTQSPAENPLASFPVEIKGDTIVINLKKS